MKKVYLSLLLLLIQLTVLSQSPALQWAKSIGQPSSVDVGTKIIPLSNGDLYFVGRFSGTVDFDPGLGVFNLTAGAAFDIVIAKYTGAGDFLWAGRLGSNTNNLNHIIDPQDAAVDNADNLYITGAYIGSIDMDPSGAQYLITPGPATLVSWQLFVAKYNSNGAIQWAFGVGSSFNPSTGANVKGLGLALNNTGNVIIAGTYHHTCDFDPGSATFALTATGIWDDIFFAEYTANGNFVWAKSINGIGLAETPTDVVIDANNNIYICGYIDYAADFDPGAGVAMVSSNGGGGDLFLAKYDANGNYQWAFSAGSVVFYDIPAGIGLDVAGNIIITGTYRGTVDFDPSSGTLALISTGTNSDIFLAKYNSTGNLLWVKSLEGPGQENPGIGIGIVTDQFSRVFISGAFSSTLDFDPSPATALLNAGPTAKAAYIAQYDNDGNYLDAAAVVGPDSYFNPWHLFVDQYQHIYFTGGFEKEADFDPAAGTFSLTAGGTTQDIFIANYSTGNATLAGTLWRDDNSNGIQDNAEPGMGGITMQMIYDKNNDGIIAANEGIITTRTLSDGSYAFSEMPQGNYIVHTVPPAGYSNTTPAMVDGDLVNGQVISNKNFGIRPSVLPIACAGFSASFQNNRVILKWTTAIESNSHGFNIQRSTDGVNFENIGWVNATGNPQTAASYSYMDNGGFSSKLYYYRLQEVSLDGTKKFVCEMALVRFTEKVKTVTVFPNPAQKYINIDMPDLPAGRLKICMYDTRATLVKTRQHPISRGSVFEQMPITELPAGIYIIIISVNDSIIAKERIIKN